MREREPFVYPLFENQKTHWGLIGLLYKATTAVHIPGTAFKAEVFLPSTRRRAALHTIHKEGQTHFVAVNKTQNHTLTFTNTANTKGRKQADQPHRNQMDLKGISRTKTYSGTIEETLSRPYATSENLLALFSKTTLDSRSTSAPLHTAARKPSRTKHAHTHKST